MSAEPAGSPLNQRGRLAVVALATVLAVAVAIWSGQHFAHRGTGAAPIRVSGLPATVPTSLAGLMQLSPLPEQPSPGFSLTDQHGATVSLSGLRGHPVLIEFMDPRCVDICPIVSQELLQAARDLGPQAASVVFVGIDVNPFHRSVSDLQAYSRRQGLDTLPNWHFLTGTIPQLEAVWRAYHVDVNAPNASADVVHTSAGYFLDPAGRQRYVVFPDVDHRADGTAYLPSGTLTDWGRGLALVLQAVA